MLVPLNFNGGEIFVDASMMVKQSQGFYCPFFLRSIRSHFYHDILPENSSDINDYDLSAIRTRLTNNPAYVITDTPKMRWNRFRANEIQLNVNLNINESIARYNVSYWQRLGLIWIQYLSILIVCWKAIDKLKDYMFSQQMIKAWEIIPWKKIYWNRESYGIMEYIVNKQITMLMWEVTRSLLLNRMFAFVEFLSSFYYFVWTTYRGIFHCFFPTHTSSWKLRYYDSVIVLIWQSWIRANHLILIRIGFER